MFCLANADAWVPYWTWRVPPPASLGTSTSARGWEIGARPWRIHSPNWANSWSIAAVPECVLSPLGCRPTASRIGMRMLGVSPSVTSISARAPREGTCRRPATREPGQRRSCSASPDPAVERCHRSAGLSPLAPAAERSRAIALASSDRWVAVRRRGQELPSRRGREVRRSLTAVLGPDQRFGPEQEDHDQGASAGKRPGCGATGFEPVTSSVSVRVRLPLCRPGTSQVARHRRGCREAVTSETRRKALARIAAMGQHAARCRHGETGHAPAPRPQVGPTAKRVASRRRDDHELRACGANKPSHVPSSQIRSRTRRRRTGLRAATTPRRSAPAAGGTPRRH
jgi:hypothetical protein